MFGRKSPKPRERFYLFPGQGGRNYRQKQQVIRRWTWFAALATALLTALVMWLLAKSKP